MVDKSNLGTSTTLYSQKFNKPEDVEASYMNSYMNNYTEGKKNEDTSLPFVIFHQNIQGLKNKVNEFMLSLHPEKPHLICFSEHHLKYDEINSIHMPSYKLSAYYSRTSLKCGGVCIFIRDNIQFSNINLQQHNKEQDLEITAIKIKFPKKNVIVFCVYRAPSGDFDYFLCHIDRILNYLYKPKTEFILCGDLNINFLERNNNQTRFQNLT